MILSKRREPKKEFLLEELAKEEIAIIKGIRKGEMQ